MIEWLKRSRLVRYFAVFALVPVAVFGTSGSAAAASSATLDFDFNAGGMYTHCIVGVGTTATAVVASSTSRCDGGPDLTPGFCQDFEPGCGSWGITYREVASDPATSCGGAGFEPYASDQNSARRTSLILSSNNAPLATGCQPTAACLSYFRSQVGSDTDVTVCAPYEPELTQPPEYCEYATVAAPVTEIKPIRDSDTAQHDETFVKGLSVNATSSPPGNDDPSRTKWFAYIVTEDDGQQLGDEFQAGSPAKRYKFQWKAIDVPIGTSVSVPPRYVTTGGRFMGPEGVPVASTVLVGYGIFMYDRGYELGPVAGWPTTSDPGALRARNIPGRCSWWWGRPIAVAADGWPDSDEPAGPVVDVPPGGGEPPVVVDPVPTDDDGSWWWVTALLNAIRAIGSAIVNLATTIAKAVGDAIAAGFKLLTGILSDLFIPSKDSWKVGQTFGQLQEKPPFSLVTELGTTGRQIANAYSASGGCPTFFTIPGYANSSVDCGDARSDGMLYGIASWGIVGSTLLGMFYRASSLFRLGQ